jgi:hypothetical protein
VIGERHRLLTRHFLRGFLENDLVSPDQGLQATLAPIVAAIAAPSLMLPLIWSFAYGWPYRRVEQFQALVLRHEIVLVMYPMVIVALVAVLQWDSLYPDRRDAEVLGRLPIPTSAMFWAKVSALLIFVGGFAVAANGPATILYPLVANLREQPGLHGPLRTLAAHIVATGAASAFAVFGVLAVMGVMQLLLPARWRRTVSPAVQLTAVLVLVLTLLMLPFVMMLVDPREHGGLAARLSLHRVYEGAGTSWASWFPPFWFLGAYEEVAGRGADGMRLLAARALWGVGIAMVASLACYLWTYRRHAAGAMLGDGPGGTRAHRGIVSRVGSRLAGLIVRQPQPRAFFAFIATTVVRSGKHRLMVAGAIGAALAFILAEATVGIETYNPARPGPQVLSAQFVFVIFLLAGARFAFAVPTVLPANWAFRFHGPEHVRACATATRRAMIWLGIVPLLALLFPVYLLLYGWEMAAMHAVIVLAASLGLVELLLAGFPKVPFASAYVPGRAMIRSRLTLYLLTFQFFAYVLSSIESHVLPRTPWAFVMLAVLVVPWLVMVRRRVVRERTAELVYDEDAPDAIQTLSLSGPAGQRLEAGS